MAPILVYSGVLLSHENDEILENFMLREVSQRERDKNPLISLMWDIKQKAMNKRNKVIGTDSRVVVARGEG